MAQVRELPPPPLTGRVQMGSNRGSLKGYTSGNPQMDAIIIKHANKQDLDPLLLLVMVGQESMYYPRAKSSDGGHGAMQLTSKQALRGITDPYDLDQNIGRGAEMLRQNLNQYGGRSDLAVAAFNTSGKSIKEAGNDIPNKYIPRTYQNKIAARYNALLAGQPDPFDFAAAQRAVKQRYGADIPIPGQSPSIISNQTLRTINQQRRNIPANPQSMQPPRPMSRSAEQVYRTGQAPQVTSTPLPQQPPQQNAGLWNRITEAAGVVMPTIRGLFGY